MKLGVFIGSFNPVHLGHIKVVNYLINNHFVDKILIVPTTNYWNKTNLIDLNKRIEMLKIYENENIMVDDQHNYEPYTYLLMRALTKDYPNKELYLIIGADNLINFDKWKNYEELLNYPIIVVNRNNIDLSNIITKYPNNHFIILSNFPFIDISSSEIRDNLDNQYLDQKVLNYIKKNNISFH